MSRASHHRKVPTCLLRVLSREAPDLCRPLFRRKSSAGRTAFRRAYLRRSSPCRPRHGLPTDPIRSWSGRTMPTRSLRRRSHIASAQIAAETAPPTSPGVWLDEVRGPEPDAERRMTAVHDVPSRTSVSSPSGTHDFVAIAVNRGLLRRHVARAASGPERRLSGVAAFGIHLAGLVVSLE